MDKPLASSGKREMDNLLHKEATRITVDGINLTYEGLLPRMRRSIDRGPGAGQDGGRVVFTGPPNELASSGRTSTGEYLARHLARGATEDENV